ncbi:MAG: hypothetical protein P1V97_32465 [Planctomycetota bacterium]|nr:hypothetical protein [Planctomycetota bacterium]
MDIDQLQRQFSASPDNEDLRAKLIIALRRNGREDEAQELVKSRFSCPVSWDQLETLSPNEMTRHCKQCDKAVHFVSNLEELNKRAEKQECVVAPPELVNQYCDQLTKNSLPLAKDSKDLPHCMNAFAGDLAGLMEKQRGNPSPRMRFKGSVGPPPHIRQQILARREQERREQGLLGWIRRKITGE